MAATQLPALPSWEQPPEQLPDTIAELKTALKVRIEESGSTVAEVLVEVDSFIDDELIDIERSHLERGSAWPEVDFDEISNDAVTQRQVREIHRRGCLVVRGHFSPDRAREWDMEIEEYVTSNDFFDDYAGPGDDFFAAVDSRPAIYPIYWSRPQMEARQSPRMTTVQRFLNRLWTNRTGGRTWFDPDRTLIYPDRIRRRPPGTSNDGLGAHLDTGNVDLWMTPAFQETFEKVFAGRPLEHDPWNGAHRSDAPKFPGSTMCSVFRTFQGWTALSQMEQNQGVLHTVPIPLAITRLLLRPLMDDVADDDLCGVEMNRAFPVTTQWHARLLDAMSPVPNIEPGDSVWWHPDLIHSVAPVSDQQGLASIMYIPAVPWNTRNAAYGQSLWNALVSGNSPADFPAEHYESAWKSRFAPADLSSLGRAGFGI